MGHGGTYVHTVSPEVEARRRAVVDLPWTWLRQVHGDRVVRVDAPYEVRVVHCGKVLRGPGSMRCTPMAGDRTQMVLHEWFHLPDGAIGKLAWPVLWPGSKLGFTGALRKFAKLVEQGRLP